MDYRIVVMEENHWKSNSAASTSKFGSLVQINSIAVDISGSMEVIESPKHEHFSIRGFVSGMRKKDRKTCLPFASEGNDVDVVDNLHPLFIPRFRWWQCSHCIPEIETWRSTEEMVVATRSDAGIDYCQNVGDKHGVIGRENTGEDNDQSKTIKKSKFCCIERCKAITGSKGKTDVRDKEAGNQHDTPEANPLQIVERLNNTTDASDMVYIAERPSCIVDEPGNASSGSDGTFSALPRRRKPKLRSLADIMVEERNPPRDNPRTRSASSCGMQVVSTEMEAVLGPQPELDVLADVAKDSTIPERKRKIDLGEDGGRLGVIYPSAATKRINRPTLDAGKNCRRVEVSDSKSKGDASMRLDLQLGARTQRIKPKKTKALDISKKMRQIHREDEIAPMREFPRLKAACSANIQKNDVPLETSFGNLGCAPSTMGEMEPGFMSSQSGQQMEQVSNHFSSKMAEVRADHDPLMPPRKSNLGDCSIRGKVALDLSLNNFMDAGRNSNNQASFTQHRGILPDLNEESPENTAMIQGQQLTLDVSPPCSNEATGEGKRQLGITEPKTKEHNKELGSSDDIPMEIVELLAKNQRERALENSRRNFLGTNNPTRRYSALCVDGRPAMIDFPLANRRSGLTMANGNKGLRQNTPINFPQPNNNRLDMSKTEKSLLWSSTRENAPPFHLSIAPKHSIQPSSMLVHSFSDRCDGGKTISDMKDGKEKRVVHSAAVIKEGRMGPISTSGSLDPYSNDTIPAMQLLSLMDQRVLSGSSLGVGGKTFLDKSFSPCNHHPRLIGNENQNFLSGSFFPQNSHSEDFSGLHYGGYCSSESSKKASSNFRVQIPQELRNSEATLLIAPARNDSALGVCTLSQNPADFSIPHASNEFTLSAKDLKFRKRNASKEKSRMVKVEGKRQRMRKDASGKECSRK